jgi:hypothetical protein
MTADSAASTPILDHKLRRYHRTRERIFQLMVDDPTANWTHRSLVEHMSDHSVEQIRTTIYLLLDCKAAELAPRERVLTIRLASGAAAVLARQIRTWVIECGQEARR